METGLQKYLGSALSVLDKFGIVQKEGEESRLAALLEDVAHVDEPRVAAIAKTVKYMGTFNALVRDNVQDMRVSDRYGKITDLFTSIREDSKRALEQLEDGVIDWKETMENLWMKIARGSTHARFERIRTTYLDVTGDTQTQLEREENILQAYIDFRFALKHAEINAQEVMQEQEAIFEEARRKFEAAQTAFEGYTGTDAAERSRLQLARDEAMQTVKGEDSRYQLIKDVAEELSNGYNVGEVMVAKLSQTHGVKEQLYKRVVTFFTTNEHVFTTMDAVYTAQRGMHETTQTLEAMKEGANKGLEDIAEIGGRLEEAALKAGYGSTYNRDSVQMLVNAIVSFQEDSGRLIDQFRRESTENTRAIEQIVEEGKRRCAAAIQRRALPAHA